MIDFFMKLHNQIRVLDRHMIIQMDQLGIILGENLNKNLTVQMYNQIGFSMDDKVSYEVRKQLGIN